MFKRGFRRFFHWTVGVLLIPFAWASLKVMMFMVPVVGAEGWRSWWVYLCGALFYILIERIFKKPMSVYVFGHELTHALSGIMMGAKIHSFRAGENEGEVKLSKTNALIALAPYILPIYAIFVLGLYVILKRWFGGPPLTYGFQFFLGLTIAFHLSLTLEAIHSRQSDLKVLGFFLSGILILIGNTLILGVLCVSLFHKTPRLSQFATALGNETVTAWRNTIHYVRRGYREIKIMASDDVQP